MGNKYSMHAEKDMTWEETANYLEQVLENVSQDRIVSVSHATYPGGGYGGPYSHSVIVVLRQPD